jgi:hypothetical protein
MYVYVLQRVCIASADAEYERARAVWFLALDNLEATLRLVGVAAKLYIVMYIYIYDYSMYCLFATAQICTCTQTYTCIEVCVQVASAGAECECTSAVWFPALDNPEATTRLVSCFAALMSMYRLHTSIQMCTCRRVAIKLTRV